MSWTWLIEGMTIAQGKEKKTLSLLAQYFHHIVICSKQQSRMKLEELYNIPSLVPLIFTCSKIRSMAYSTINQSWKTGWFTFPVTVCSFLPILSVRTTAHLTWQAVGQPPKSSSVAEGQQYFHLHTNGFEILNPNLFKVSRSPRQGYTTDQSSLRL